MSSFAALMALSATQTRQSEAAVQSALVERQRKEAQRRKEQEERERRERELEVKMRLKRLEEEKREQERQRRQEQEREARERERRRREEEERDRLRYGPKKPASRTDSKGYPLSGAIMRRGRSSSSDDESSAANALTREEKRKRRMELELRHGQTTRRSTHSSGYGKAGKQLPGGAMDITTTATGANKASSDPNNSLSVRQRLASAPAMLIKLNVNKRDTRTIDEILQDRAKAKANVLQGEQAKEFSDWFGKGKTVAKKDSSQTDSASTSRAHTPAATSAKVASGSASPAGRTPSVSKPTAPAATFKPAAAGQRPAVAKNASVKSATSSSTKSTVASSRSTVASSKSSVSYHKPPLKKRPRSPSLSPSPSPPSKKRGSVPNDISSEIWKMFGKDRSRYVADDVFSDDDMEAGASDLEREEMRSARIAKREDELAMEEERRHEEEKRRKRREKELREKQRISS